MISIACDQVPEQRWKNGGGSLRELLLQPPGDAWQVRVAVADIDADGPFSEFAGIRRCFAVIDGAGVDLAIGRPGAVTTYRRTPSDAPLFFDAATPTHCRLLDGSVRALNLMLRDAQGRIEAVDETAAWLPAAASCGIYTAVPGRCNDEQIAADTLLWFEAAPDHLRFFAHPGAARIGPVGWWLAAMPQEATR